MLVLDADNGDIRHSFPRSSRAVAFAGAALMDLALERRISTDLWRPEILVVSDPTPLGSDLLDPILEEIALAGEATRETAFWITELARRSDEIREQALARLIGRGILEADTGGEVYLSTDISRARRYNTGDDKSTEEVQLRIMRALFSDDIPNPRDIVIISLASASGVFESILSPYELEQVRERIDSHLRAGPDRPGDCGGHPAGPGPAGAGAVLRSSRRRNSRGGRAASAGQRLWHGGGPARLSAAGIPAARADIQGAGFESPLGRSRGPRSERLRRPQFSHTFPYLGAVPRIRRCIGRPSRPSVNGRPGAYPHAPTADQGLFPQDAGVQSGPERTTLPCGR